MSSPTSTTLYPIEERWYQTAPDPLTAIRIAGTGLTFPLPPGQTSFLLGRSPICDLRVDLEFIAKEHARIDRVGSHGNVCVKNISSGKNDLVHNGEIAEQEFTLSAGEWFDIGRSRFYVLNEEMRLAWPWLLETLGVNRYDAIDELSITAVRESSRHVLLIGEPGGRQEQIAQLIHRISRRRHNGFHALGEGAQLDDDILQAIHHTKGGTVFVHLYQKGRLDPRLTEVLTRPAAKLRLIICARSPDKAEASFGTSLTTDAKKVDILPLRERKADIPDLLNKWFVSDGSPLRFSRLRPELRESLLAYRWPENLDELHQFVEDVEPLARFCSERQAARESKISRSRWRTWAANLGVKLQLPLISDTHSG